MRMDNYLDPTSGACGQDAISSLKEEELRYLKASFPRQPARGMNEVG